MILCLTTLSTLSPFHLWSLVTLAGTAVHCYGNGLVSRQPILVIRGFITAWHGVKFSAVGIFTMAKGFWRQGRKLALGGRSATQLNLFIAVVSNLMLSVIALVANAVALVGPGYLLWELFLAQNPMVLPYALVWGFRALIDLAIDLGSILLTLLLVWFFIEEFTPGPNSLFDTDQLIDQPFEDQSGQSQRTSTRTTARRVEANQVESSLDDIEKELRRER